MGEIVRHQQQLRCAVEISGIQQGTPGYKALNPCYLITITRVETERHGMTQK